MVNKEKIDKILHFSKEYSNIQYDRILLGCNSIPNELKKDVAIQVDIKKKLASKIPSWCDFKVYIPEKINLEQASGELTAKYKSKYIKKDDIIVDLTSGLGVDLFFMSLMAKKGIHIEQDTNLSYSAKHNYQLLLGKEACLDKFIFISDNFENVIENVIKEHSPNVIYIDPARRSNDNKEKRLYSIEDCYPNIIDVIPEIHRLNEIHSGKIDRYIVKISPMFDITELTRKVKNIENIDIISVRGEVKEILLNISSRQTKNTLITSINILSDYETIEYSSYRSEKYDLMYSPPMQYIYEMNAATFKSELYKNVAADFKLKLISEESKLMTSDKIEEGFPGRIMKLENVLPFSKSNIKFIRKMYNEAQVRTRCFPITSDVLRNKLSVSESELLRIIGTKDEKGNYILLVCSLVF